MSHYFFMKKSKTKKRVVKTTVIKTQVVSSTVSISLVASMAVFGFSFFWSDAAQGGYDNSEGVALAGPTTLAEYTQQVAGYALAVKHAPSNAGLIAKLQETAAERQALLLRVAESNPDLARENLISNDLSAGLPASARDFLEQIVTEEGTLELMHYDVDMEAGIKRHEAFLVNGDRRTRLYTDDLERLEDSASATVRVHGARLHQAAILLADDTNSSGGTTASVEIVSEASTVIMAERKVAAILFNFVNDTRQNQTADQIRNTIFVGSKSTNTYDQEVSFGQLKLVGKLRTDGDVFGWYTLPDTYNSSTQDCSTSYRTWSTAARQMAINDGIDLTGYDHFFYIMPPTGYCPGSGWAEVRADESWINGSGATFGTITHEHGHNLGNWHASSNSCTNSSGQRVSVSTTCTMGEYGDPFDIMGSSGGGRHFSLAHKQQVGWLPAENILDVTTDGVYTITPNEVLSSSPMVLRVPRERNSIGQVARAYWIEYRKTFGTYDNFGSSDPAVNGVMVRTARMPGVSGGGTSNTLLYDSLPGTTSFTDASLPVGQIFDDPIYGLRFETVAIGPDSAAVRITFVPATCVPGTPNITITNPVSTLATSGQTLYYNLNITNTDSVACAPSTISLTSVIPTDWTQTPAATSLTLQPGQTTSVTAAVRSAADALAGTYALTETVTNLTTYLTKSASTTYTVIGPDTTAPTVSITSPLNGSVVRSKNAKLNATASDISGLGTIALKLNGTVVKTCSNTTVCTHTMSLAKGAYTLTAEATDASPNANLGTAVSSFSKR